MILIGQHERSGDYVSENSREGVKNGNVDQIKVALKKQKVYFFFRFFKNKKHGALRNSISKGSMFFVFKKSKKKIYFLVFVTPDTFVNISIFHTFPRVVRDIVATWMFVAADTFFFKYNFQQKYHNS